MVPCCNTEAGGEVVGNSPDGGLELERDPPGLHAAVEGDADDEGDVEPVDVLVPVRTGHGGFCDMWLLRVVLGVSVGFRGFGGGGWLGGHVFWFDSQVASSWQTGRHTGLMCVISEAVLDGERDGEVLMCEGGKKAAGVCG
jgi:hypothetical protein